MSSRTSAITAGCSGLVGTSTGAFLAMKASLSLPADAFRFLEYHGSNDEHHLARWLRAIEIVLEHDADGEGARAIIATARRTAELYLMQFDHVMPA